MHRSGWADLGGARGKHASDGGLSKIWDGCNAGARRTTGARRGAAKHVGALDGRGCRHKRAAMGFYTGVPPFVISPATAFVSFIDLRRSASKPLTGAEALTGAPSALVGGAPSALIGTGGGASGTAGACADDGESGGTPSTVLVSASPHSSPSNAAAAGGAGDAGGAGSGAGAGAGACAGGVAGDSRYGGVWASTPPGATPHANSFRRIGTKPPSANFTTTRLLPEMPVSAQRRPTLDKTSAASALGSTSGPHTPGATAARRRHLLAA